MTATLLPSTSLNSPVVHKLPNGLTIVAEQMPVEAVNLNVWLNVGSIVESDEINGMAHFLEHMIFKGTPQLKSGEFEKIIEAKGAMTNAATSQEYTHYYITTAPSDFAKLVPLQLDVVLNPSIPDDAFQRERMVVLEEIRRSYDNPRRRIFYRSMETSFDRLPYRRPVLGTTEVVESLTPQQMRDFHDHLYQPQAMTVAAVGNIPTDDLIDMVAESFEQVNIPDKAVPNPDFFNKDSLTPEPNFTEIIRKEYVDESLQEARLVMVWRVPGIKYLQKTYPLDVLSAILGRGKMSRLFRDLREERKLVSSISVSNLSQGIQGVFYISARLPQSNLKVVEEAIINHIYDLQTEAITPSELERISTQVANRYVFGNERPSDRANLYGYYQSLLGDLTPAFNYPESIRSLEIKDIQAAAQKYLNTKAYGILTILSNK